ncbi:MAG: NAD(P)H-dependent oxidoreductase subunit E [Planctomycetes bacterium]|nr:NAD(P)H-dependent oxidoreductase subunit E [Planctomycetota bacterium]
MALPQTITSELDALVTHYPDRRAALIPALHRCQEQLGGWLSPQTLEDLAAYFGLEPVEVFGVAFFYPMFRLRPRGRHLVSVCHNVSCSLRGAEQLLEHVCKVTGAPVGGTSPDGRFSVVRVECQGACANAPMLDLDGTFHEDLDPERAERILRSAP